MSDPAVKASAIVAKVGATMPTETRVSRRRKLSTIKMFRTKYLWEGYLPAGELTILAGKPGIGKSTIAADVAAKITRGQLLGDYKGEPQPVLYSLTEDAPKDLRKRFRAAGGDDDQIELFDVTTGGVDGAPVQIVQDMAQLREALLDLKPALFVLDALNSSIAGQYNDNANVRPQLELLRALAQETGTAILGIGHFIKATNGIEPLDAIGGAGAYGQVVRHALGCARDEEAKAGTLSVIKSNLGSTEVDSLGYRFDSHAFTDDDGVPDTCGLTVWTGTANVSVRDLLSRAPATEEERSSRNEAKEFLEGFLADNGGSASAADIYKAGQKDGFSRDQLKRAKTPLGVVSHRTAFGKGGEWIWSLPGAVSTTTGP